MSLIPCHWPSQEQVFHFELSPGDGCSLVLLQLQTGRQHQIRAHLSACGHPLLGDTDYGSLAHEIHTSVLAWGQQEQDINESYRIFAGCWNLGSVNADFQWVPYG